MFVFSVRRAKHAFSLLVDLMPTPALFSEYIPDMQHEHVYMITNIHYLFNLGMCQNGTCLSQQNIYV